MFVSTIEINSLSNIILGIIYKVYVKKDIYKYEEK